MSIPQVFEQSLFLFLPRPINLGSEFSVLLPPSCLSPFFLWALEFPDRMEAAKLKTRSQDLSDAEEEKPTCLSLALLFFCNISSLYIPSFSALLGKRKRAMPKIAAAHRSHEAFSQLKRGPSSKALHPPLRCSQQKPIFLYRSSSSSAAAAEKERTLPPSLLLLLLIRLRTLTSPFVRVQEREEHHS